MSRSRKKHPVYKDRSFKHGVYNRIFRRVNKQRIKMGKEPIQMGELINQYDICDWILWVDKEDSDYYKKAKRK